MSLNAPDYAVILGIVAIGLLAGYVAATKTDNPVIPVAIAAIVTLSSLAYAGKVRSSG